MNKFRRLLPLLVLFLVLAYFLLPTQNSSVAPGPEPASSAADALSLVSSSPASVSSGTGSEQGSGKTEKPEADASADEGLLPEDGSYTTKEDVSLYLVQYGRLPNNFITKKEAREAGWEGGSLEKILPGMCIGGDYFGNYEGKLPKAKGRSWTECDINTLGKRSRGAERLIFSNDGLIYYTDDHYESFTQLY